MDGGNPYSDVFDCDEYNLIGDLDLVSTHQTAVVPLNPSHLAEVHTPATRRNPMQIGSKPRRTSASPRAEAGRCGSCPAVQNDPVVLRAHPGPLFGRRSNPAGVAEPLVTSATTACRAAAETKPTGAVVTTTTAGTTPSPRSSAEAARTSPPHDNNKDATVRTKATTSGGVVGRTSLNNGTSHDTVAQRGATVATLPVITATDHSPHTVSQSALSQLPPRPGTKTHTTALNNLKLPFALLLARNRPETEKTNTEGGVPSTQQNGWHASLPRFARHDAAHETASPRAPGTPSRISDNESSVERNSIQEVKRLVAEMEKREREQKTQPRRDVGAGGATQRRVSNEAHVTTTARPAVRGVSTASPVLSTTEHVSPHVHRPARAPLRPAPVKDTTHPTAPPPPTTTQPTLTPVPPTKTTPTQKPPPRRALQPPPSTSPPKWQGDYEMDLLMEKELGSFSLPTGTDPQETTHTTAKDAARLVGAAKRVVMHATVTDTATAAADTVVPAANTHAAAGGDVAAHALRTKLEAWQNLGLLSLTPNTRRAGGGSSSSSGYGGSQGGVKSGRRPRQRVPTAQARGTPVLEMAGEAVEMNAELHNVLVQMCYRALPLQLVYPARLPVEMEGNQRTRRPRTPRSFYGKAGPQLGPNWFKGALDDAITIDSPNIALLEAEEEKNGRVDKRHLARVGNQPVPTAQARVEAA